MDVTSGFLLVADISDYTRFLVASELRHAKEILDTLLTTMIGAIRAPVHVFNTQGDAVFALVGPGSRCHVARHRKPLNLRFGGFILVISVLGRGACFRLDGRTAIVKA